MDRRSVLKLFGIGAVIAPVIRGVATADQAMIVKPPEVELMKAPEIVGVPSLGEFGQSDIIMLVRDRRSGLVDKYEVSGFLMEQRDLVDVTNFASAERSFIPSLLEMHFTVTGRPVWTNSLVLAESFRSWSRH